MVSAAETLQQAILWFSHYENCHRAVMEIRWPDGVVRCPRCGSEHVTYLENARVWKCYAKHPMAKFSLKVGTVFEDSPIPLQKWLPALWLITNCKNGISSYELSRALGVTQKSAWFMLQRLRLALQSADGGKLGGDVEVDETFIGGKSRNMHKSKRDRVIKGTGGKGKVAVMGLLAKVRLSVQTKGLHRGQLPGDVRQHVEAGSNVYTDAFRSYIGLDDAYVHGVIDHAEAYVNGQVHTNGLENFWSLLKRALKGTYVSVEAFHLFRYLYEQAFRFNERHSDDASRFVLALEGIINKRLTYSTLTGSEWPQRC